MNAISISAPSGTIGVNTRDHDVMFDVQSSVPNPSLAAKREIEVAPTTQVKNDTHYDIQDWPVGAGSVPHTAKLDPRTSDPSGETTFTATVTMPPVSSFAAKTKAVKTKDERISWFASNINHGLVWRHANQGHRYSVGDNPAYFGGQLPLQIKPFLNGDTPNPGLPVHVRGTLKKNGTVIPGGAFSDTEFGPTASQAFLGGMVVVQSGTPPAGAVVNDEMELDIEFLNGLGGTVFHSIPTLRFDVTKGALETGSVASDVALMAADDTWLNRPPEVADSLRSFLKSSPNAHYNRVEAALASGLIYVKPTFVRSDSLDYIKNPSDPSNPRGDQTSQVAYACGGFTDAETLVGGPGAAGWHRGGDTVYLNATKDPANPTKTDLGSMARLLSHEAVHAADLTPGPGGDIGRYKKEFRAYWTDGRFDGTPTDLDESFTRGPKGKRANRIFELLYQSTLYAYVKQSYDSDAEFRREVDVCVFPEGLNLVMSKELDDLRQSVRSSTGSFADKHALIKVNYEACVGAGVHTEIAKQASWRTLVENHFSASDERVPGSSPPRSEPAWQQIFALIGVPT